MKITTLRESVLRSVIYDIIDGRGTLYRVAAYAANTSKTSITRPKEANEEPVDKGQ